MGKKILIVDDSPMVIALLSKLINKSELDADIITACNGKEACKQAIKHLPDLIIMDWEMPIMDGLQAITNIKSSELTVDIPIIILSESTTPVNIQLALNAGATYYLKKPIDEIELIARINAASNLSTIIRDLKAQRNKLILSNHKNDTILRSILPEPILNQIKQYGSIPPKCYHNNVVMFVDMVDFTSKSGKMSPGTLLKELHDTFNVFDKVIEIHHCTRIKTIGDAYMAVCGMFEKLENVELEAVKAAEKIREAIIERNQTNKIKWEIKIGLYSGDVICSSVSSTNLSFDIFGETVNMASRFQDACEPMQINVSDKIQKKVSDHYKIVSRTPRKVKGKGTVPMFYIHKPINKDNILQTKGIASISNPLHLMN